MFKIRILILIVIVVAGAITVLCFCSYGDINLSQQMTIKQINSFWGIDVSNCAVAISGVNYYSPFYDEVFVAQCIMDKRVVEEILDYDDALNIEQLPPGLSAKYGLPKSESLDCFFIKMQTVKRRILLREEETSRQSYCIISNPLQNGMVTVFFIVEHSNWIIGQMR